MDHSLKQYYKAQNFVLFTKIISQVWYHNYLESIATNDVIVSLVLYFFLRAFTRTATFGQKTFARKNI